MHFRIHLLVYGHLPDTISEENPQIVRNEIIATYQPYGEAAYQTY
jgi:hypothetical protein